MSTFLVLCPTHRDRRELALLDECRGHTFLLHEYGTTELEEMISPAGSAAEVAHVEEELERIFRKYDGAHINGVISTDDYPGSALASIVARHLRLPGTPPRVCLLCQHKYHARVAARAILPEVVPRFALLGDTFPPEPQFPAFIKPVKSCFSVGAYRVDNEKQLRELRERATLPERFFAPFRTLFERYVGIPFGLARVVMEELLQGQQVSLEGYAFDGQVHIVGIVDAIMFPDTQVFQRFQYPSRLPEPVQQRMCKVATTLMRGIGFDHGFFNIELMYNPDRDTIHIIEINPRMASQFADLYEKVDGYNTYATLLDLARGVPPRPKQRQGKHRMAVSHVLRRFHDARVLKTPERVDVARLRKKYPDVRVEVLATKGRRLSEELQEGTSYRYGIVNCGGSDLADAEAALDYCIRRLPFVLLDLPLDAAGEESSDDARSASGPALAAAHAPE